MSASLTSTNLTVQTRDILLRCMFVWATAVLEWLWTTEISKRLLTILRFLLENPQQKLDALFDALSRYTVLSLEAIAFCLSTVFTREKRSKEKKINISNYRQKHFQLSVFFIFNHNGNYYLISLSRAVRNFQ